MSGIYWHIKLTHNYLYISTSLFLSMKSIYIIYLFWESHNAQYQLTQKAEKLSSWHFAQTKVSDLNAASRHFSGICFLKAIVLNVYHSHMEEGKTIWTSPNISISDAFVNVIFCVFWKDICFRSICRLFNLVFIWNMHWKNLFGCIFLGTHTVQTLPKHIWMQHCWTS